MHENHCPQCGCPLTELVAASTHRSAEGRLRYHRCVCGNWLIELDGGLLGATRREPEVGHFDEEVPYSGKALRADIAERLKRSKPYSAKASRGERGSTS